MSTDYYSRLEQQRGPQPSEQMLASIARALRLSGDERDHLFRVAGRAAPSRRWRSDHVGPALMRVLDRLDTPAQVVSDLGYTLVQNPLAVALLGDQTQYTGHARSIFYRYFTDPEERRIYPVEDREAHARSFVAGLRAVAARADADAEADELVRQLTQRSEEFARLWAEHQVAVRTSARKRMIHPTIGTMTLDCQTLVAENHAQALLVYTATPGTEDHDKLELLSVVGRQEFSVKEDPAVGPP